MKIDVERLFDSALGKTVYENFERAISDYSMDKLLCGGVLVGFSGGADSALLLCLLKKYSEKNVCPKIAVLHVNHLIRGEEAERDETFARDFAHSLGVEFIAVKRNVPLEAKKASKGIEETARNIRYSVFDGILQSRTDISCVAVAHNATDNLETVIFNMMRGAGTRGIAGIAPVRDKIIRPLIYTAKRDVTALMRSADVPYVTDSTNGDTAYKRNYIRSEIIPKLFGLTDNPEAQAMKLSANLRMDDAFIYSEAERFLRAYPDKVPYGAISVLPPALMSRVIFLLAGSVSVERVHVDNICRLFLSGVKNFSVNIPGGNSFICRDGMCCVGKLEPEQKPHFEKKLAMGVNVIPEINAEITLSYSPVDNFSSKVYKTAIQQSIDFDIIEGELSVRNKIDGDSYTYGGMTRKLKKLFNEKKIPEAERLRIPIVCDGRGILWVPGFKVRDGGKKSAVKRLFISIGYSE